MSLPAYAHGTITGAGPHSGVRLILIEWPKQSVMAKVRVGQHVRTRVIGHATSSSTGAYSIHPTVELKNGLVNLEIIGRSSGAVGAFGFGGVVHGTSIVPADSRGHVGPVAANIRMVKLPKSALSAIPDDGPVCPAPSPGKVKELGQKPVTVGGLYGLLSPDKLSMTYMVGSRTTIGIGFSFNKDFLGFNADGSFTMSSSGQQNFPSESGFVGDDMQTTYSFGLYEFCHIFQVQPEQWALGGHIKTVDVPGAHHCSSQLAGQVDTRSTGKAGTFSAGVNLKKVIGVNLAAQSGYSNQVSISWSFPEGGWLCGTNALPGASAFNVTDQSMFGNNPGPAVRHSRASG